MNKKIVYAILAVVLIVVVAGSVYAVGKRIKKTGTGPSGSADSKTEVIKEASYNDYFTSAFLGKLPENAPFSTTGISKTKTFSKGDQFCVSLNIKKEIPADKFATEIFDTDKNLSVQPKTSFPQAQPIGDNTGCSNLRYETGNYEYRVYVNESPVITLPFEVK